MATIAIILYVNEAVMQPARTGVSRAAGPAHPAGAPAFATARGGPWLETPIPPPRPGDPPGIPGPQPPTLPEEPDPGPLRRGPIPDPRVPAPPEPGPVPPRQPEPLPF